MVPLFTEYIFLSIHNGKSVKWLGKWIVGQSDGMRTLTYMRKCKNITLALYETVLILLMWKFSFRGFMQHKYTKFEPVTVKECVYKWWPFD